MRLKPLVILSLLIFLSCQQRNTDDELVKDNLIIEFSLLADNNSTIKANIEGVIDSQKNTISLTLPFSFNPVDFNFTPTIVV